MNKRVTIHLLIDQEIPEKDLDKKVNDYIDLLAKTGGELTWNECGFTVEDAE